jgi:2-iminobutanoate/2-iminopropanoate deaminase
MGVVLGEGRIVHLKGQVSLDRRGHVVGVRDMRAQVVQTLKNISDVLATVGGEMSDIVSLTHYVTDIEAFMGASDLRKQFFSPPYPVTTTVQVSRLYDPNLLVEIASIAEIPAPRFKQPKP